MPAPLNLGEVRPPPGLVTGANSRASCPVQMGIFAPLPRIAMPLKAGGAQIQTPSSTRAYAVGEKSLPHIQETRGAHLRILAGDAPASVMWESDQPGGGPPASGATQIAAPPPAALPVRENLEPLPCVAVS